MCEDVKEDLPTNAPPSLDEPVIIASCVDANLVHDILTKRFMSDILHYFNQTPIEWFAKKQNTAETATHGFEFVAARLCAEQVTDLRTMSRYCGVSVNERTHMFEDNDSVVKSSTIFNVKLQKRHHILFCHAVREKIAAGYLRFLYLSKACDPADILGKH